MWGISARSCEGTAEKQVASLLPENTLLVASRRSGSPVTGPGPSRESGKRKSGPVIDQALGPFGSPATKNSTTAATKIPTDGHVHNVLSTEVWLVNLAGGHFESQPLPTGQNYCRVLSVEKSANVLHIHMV